jgi:CRP-like cAMP-binding protein
LIELLFAATCYAIFRPRRSRRFTRVRTRRLGPGQILFSAGDQILEGDRPIASLGEGEAFGEMALLRGSSRTATAQSAGDVELLGD